MSTLTVPSPGLCSSRDDAIKLHKAFKGLGCNTSKVTSILAHRDSTQRDLIQQEYETAFSEPLSKRISSELHGNIKKSILLWLHDPPTRDATILRQALIAPVADYQAITEVICSRTPTQIRRFKDVYLSTYHSNLEQDIDSITSGDHKKLLLAYISTPRYEGPELDYSLVRQDAQLLYQSREKMMKTDFIRIFSERSSVHLAAISSSYESFGNSLEKAIQKETPGPFRSGLLAILRCSINPALYFAKILRKSMKGIGTDDSRLIRVIVSRTEIDMQYIKAEYYSRYKRPLTHDIHSDTTGSYRNFLITLIGSD